MTDELSLRTFVHQIAALTKGGFGHEDNVQNAIKVARSFLAAHPDHSGDGGEKVASTGSLAFDYANAVIAKKLGASKACKCTPDDSADCEYPDCTVGKQAAPVPQDGDERAAFEVYMRGIGEDYLYRRDVATSTRFGEYCRQDVQDQWDTWQAALASSKAAAVVARPTDDALWDQTLTERDNYHEWADKLANAIAEHFGIEIGEHSNLNNPWSVALEALESAPVAAAVAVEEPMMTNGDFHCPACGQVMKGPTACGSCLWERDTCGYTDNAKNAANRAAFQAWFDGPKRKTYVANEDSAYKGWQAAIELLAPPAPIASTEEAVTTAARDVLAERKRHKDVEGFAAEHDDGHPDGDLAIAAACYAANAGGVPWSGETPSFWPWDNDWWKPTTPRRDLVKAGSLILAEIERIDRSAKPS